MVDVHLNWLKYFHFLFLEVGLLVILIDCMILLVPFLDVGRMWMSTVFFLAQLDSSSLPIECFPSTFDLNGFKPGINNLLTIGSLKTDFLYA